MKNPLASGLSGPSRAASWLVAIGVVVAWNYKDQVLNSGGKFTKKEMKEWNKEKKPDVSHKIKKEVKNTKP